MPIDAIVAGAGMWGCMVARRLVVDGNMRCECVDGAPWEEKLLW